MYFLNIIISKYPSILSIFLEISIVSRTLVTLLCYIFVMFEKYTILFSQKIIFRQLFLLQLNQLL